MRYEWIDHMTGRTCIAYDHHAVESDALTDGGQRIPGAGGAVRELLRLAEENRALKAKCDAWEAVVRRQEVDMRADAKEDADNRARIAALEAEVERVTEHFKIWRAKAEALLAEVERLRGGIATLNGAIKRYHASDADVNLRQVVVNALSNRTRDHALEDAVVALLSLLADSPPRTRLPETCPWCSGPVAHAGASCQTNLDSVERGIAAAEEREVLEPLRGRLHQHAAPGHECLSVTPSGRRCVLPARHHGMHSDGTVGWYLDPHHPVTPG